jgi:hypothetical protein
LPYSVFVLVQLLREVEDNVKTDCDGGAVPRNGTGRYNSKFNNQEPARRLPTGRQTGAILQKRLPL